MYPQVLRVPRTPSVPRAGVRAATTQQPVSANAAAAAYQVRLQVQNTMANLSTKQIDTVHFFQPYLPPLHLVIAPKVTTPNSAHAFDKNLLSI